MQRQHHNLASNPVQYRYSYDGSEESLERFFHMAQAAEREACAKVVENHALGYAEPVWAFKLIDTIRTRGAHQNT